MTTMFYVGTHGPDDPTRATMPFHMAMGALDAGFHPQVLVAGDATYVMKDKVAAEIRGVAMPSLTEAIQKVVAGGGEILVCGGFAAAPEVVEADYHGMKARVVTPKN